jgi:hypothetical protein
VEPQRTEVLRQLARAGFKGENQLAKPCTYQEAVEAITDHVDELDVVFLDLNLPRDESDSRPEKGHGRNLLKLIHRTHNPRANIRVIVVSGEDLLDGFHDQNMYDTFKGTLVRIANKSDLTTTLKRCLKELRRDPVAQHLRRVGLSDVLELYEVVRDQEQSAGERTKAARALGLLLVRYEVDHHLGKVGASRRYADNLNGLIKDDIEGRFATDNRGRRRIKIGAIESRGGWDAFLWRGSMVQHLYALNSYRNAYEHLREQPYVHGNTNTWEIPSDTIQSVREGRMVCMVVEAIVRDLLEWYLPWYEQVYRPWREEQS